MKVLKIARITMLICITIFICMVGIKLSAPFYDRAEAMGSNLEKAKIQVTQVQYIKNNICRDFESEFGDYDIRYENHSDIIDVTDQYSGVFKGWNINNGYVYETIIYTHDGMEFSASYVFDKTADEPITTFYKGVNKAAIDFKNESQFNS